MPEQPQKEAIKAAADVPKYGGTLTLSTATEITSFDLTLSMAGNLATNLTNEGVREGDWAKGSAGGYGTGEATFHDYTTLDFLKTGYLAESVTWVVDPGGVTATITIEVRPGVHYALNRNSEASRLVNGRQVTTDDIAYALNARMNNPAAMAYQWTPNIRGHNVVKTGTWELKLTLPTETFISDTMRLIDYVFIFPPEVVQKYGDMSDWRNSVGTGPFMLTENIPGSMAVLVRNPNHWMKNPVGPGKGNGLPYLDRVQFVVLPDVSTQQAALRTAKIDSLTNVSLEDAGRFQKEVPALQQAEAALTGIAAMQMRTDKVPFSDIRVRRAMMMGIDFQSINDALYHGKGQILSWPWYYTKEFADLYIGLDDPEMPASVKELYSYNPDKAKQLLKDAGYPAGFKTSMLLLSTEVDYYSIIKDMWAKIGIDLRFDIKESAAKTAILTARSHEALASNGQPPVTNFPSSSAFNGPSYGNSSLIDDPIANAAYAKYSSLAITDMHAAMKVARQLTPYILDQVWAIPTIRYSSYTFWWPWVKGYSGEQRVGSNYSGWPRWVWVDSELKKSMGY
jgi:peptide/nickel transport system substrate-binding protein